MIEYISLKSHPSIDEAMTALKRPEAQHIKVFINTNSVRATDRVISDPTVFSNRYSFHSLGGEPKVRSRN